MKPNDVAIRKRSQIAKANRTMFLWIAAASALIGCAVVVSIFMFQKAAYNERVLSEKQKTVTTLENNNKAVPDLQNAIRVLDTNEDLMSVKANESDQAVQVILDALPSDANSLALGASLQNKLLSGVPGLTVLSLQVDPVVGVELLSEESGVDQSATEGGGNVITFQFSVTGSQDALKQVLNNLERSIRTMQVMSVRIEGAGSGLPATMFVQAKTNYQPQKTVELQKKEVER
jgi:hypothetical protein